MSNGGTESESKCPCCKALWVKFYLTENLSRSDQKAKAKVYSDNDGRHFWQGEDPDPNDEGFDVYNLEERRFSEPEAVTYIFAGGVDSVGLAVLDDTDPEQERYRIVTLADVGESGSESGSESGACVRLLTDVRITVSGCDISVTKCWRTICFPDTVFVGNEECD